MDVQVKAEVGEENGSIDLNNVELDLDEIEEGEISLPMKDEPTELADIADAEQIPPNFFDDLLDLDDGVTDSLVGTVSEVKYADVLRRTQAEQSLTVSVEKKHASRSTDITPISLNYKVKTEVEESSDRRRIHSRSPRARKEKRTSRSRSKSAEKKRVRERSDRRSSTERNHSREKRNRSISADRNRLRETQDRSRSDRSNSAERIRNREQRDRSNSIDQDYIREKRDRRHGKSLRRRGNDVRRSVSRERYSKKSTSKTRTRSRSPHKRRKRSSRSPSRKEHKEKRPFLEEIADKVEVTAYEKETVQRDLREKASECLENALSSSNRYPIQNNFTSSSTYQHENASTSSIAYPSTSNMYSQLLKTHQLPHLGQFNAYDGMNIMPNPMAIAALSHHMQPQLPVTPMVPLVEEEEEQGLKVSQNFPSFFNINLNTSIGIPGFKKIKLEKVSTPVPDAIPEIPCTPQKKKEKSIELCKAVVKQLRISELAHTKGNFAFTSTVVRANNCEKLTNRSALTSVHNAPLDFNTLVSSKIKLSDWGMHRLSKPSAKFAIALGIDAEHLLDKLEKSKFKEKCCKKENNRESMEPAHSSFYANATTQTDEIFPTKNRTRGFNIGTQTMICNPVESQTLDSKNDPPIMKMIRSLNEHQLLALNDLAELICAPTVTDPIEISRLRERMMEIYRSSKCITTLQPIMPQAAAPGHHQNFHSQNVHPRNIQLPRAPNIPPSHVYPQNVHPPHIHPSNFMPNNHFPPNPTAFQPPYGRGSYRR